MTKIDIRGTVDELGERAVKRDALVRKSPAEIDAWIEANITATPSVKELLKLLARGLRMALKQPPATNSGGTLGP